MRESNRNHNGRNAVLNAIALLAALLTFPAVAHALVWSTTPTDGLCTTAAAQGPTSTTDTDGDGFTDYEECFGFTAAGTTQPDIFGYKQDAGTATTPDRLDPAKPDLLYLATNEKGDGDLTDPNSLLVKAMATLPNGVLNVYANGLNIRAHRVYLANVNTGTDRLVISGNTTTRAARIAEVLTPANIAAKDTALGLTPEGKPSVSSVYSKIFTKRIYDNVYANCASDTACSIAKTLPLIKLRNEIVSYYILQVVAHEMGHGSLLAKANTDGYYHYSKSGSVMDPSVVFSRGVYTIPTNFNSADPSVVTLK